jgi:hypothetical protein
MGYPAARYEVPPERPAGDVVVASFGLTEVRGEGEHEADVLHVRILVSNDAGLAP